MRLAIDHYILQGHRPVPCPDRYFTQHNAIVLIRRMLKKMGILSA